MTGRTEPLAGATLRGLLVAAAVAALVPALPAAAQIVIDDFTTEQAPLSDPPGGASSVPTAGADILGGRRDLAVDLEGGGPGPVVAEVTAGALVLAVTGTTPDSAGRVVATWDGDTDPNVFDPAGLGSVDLTVGGARGFRLAVNEATVGAQLVLTVYTDATHFSDVARLLPVIAAPTTVLIGFEELLPGRGAAGPVDLADVGAIVLSVASGEGQVVVDALETVAPAVAATKVDLLAADGSPITGPVPPGTVVRYRVTVTNTGGTGTAVQLADVLDGELALDADSVRSQPMARHDQYRTAPGTAVDSLADSLPSLLVNDSDADGDPVAATAATVASAQGGSAVIAADGHFVYTPPAGFGGVDAFDYTLATVAGDPAGPVNATASVLVQNLPPVVTAGGTLASTENDPPTAIDPALTVTDPDGTSPVGASVAITGGYVNGEDVLGFTDTGAINGNWSAATGTLTLTGTDSVANYQTALRSVTYENTSEDPSESNRTVTWRVDDGFDISDPATSTITVAAVDDPPVAVADLATVIEDSGATTIDVLANDTDVDGGPISIASATDPAFGTVVVTGGGTGLTYQPDLNYCNDPPGTTPDTFTYNLAPGSSSTTVAVTVTCVNDPPVAGADAFDFVGNTELRVDHGPAATPHALETTAGGAGVLENDSDPVEGDPITIVGLTVGACIDVSAPFDCSDPAVGRVQLDADGSFSFQPAPGDVDATETFQYTVSDGTDTAIGTVTLTRFERVWYVNNGAAAGGDGTSAAPFDAITLANLNDNDGDGDLTDDLDAAGDYLFVHFGAGTAAGLSSGLFLEGGQHLIGEHAGLSLPVDLNGNGAPTLLAAAVPGSRPLLDDTVADGFEGVVSRNAIPAEIAGMSLAGNVNAIDLTTTAAFAGAGTLVIRDNVVRSAGAEGIDLNLAGTGTVTLALHDNTVTATGNGVDVAETGAGALVVTRFDDNVVTGNTGGAGILLGPATFDASPGGALDPVNGGAIVIGAAGNGVGGSAMILTGVTGDLAFTDLDLFADGGTGLSVSGTGFFTGAAGTRLTVPSSVAIVEATGGPAVSLSNLTADLQLSSLRSTNSVATGVSLVNLADGTTSSVFSASTSSSIQGALGTAFEVSGGNAQISYAGTITNAAGTSVSVANRTADSVSFTGAINDTGAGILLNANGASTVSFSGGLTISSGANTAFAATGGGTVTVTGSANTLTTTTASALNVANTTIGAAGLTFRSISSNGGANPGIMLNATDTLGGLTVAGTGGAGSGGTIQNKTGDGISLTNTRSVSLSSMVVDNNDGSGIRGDDVTDFSLIGSSVTNNGDTTGGFEAGLRFDELLGTCAITSSTISGSVEDNIRLTPASGVLTDLAISNTTIGPNNALTGGNGLAVVGTGTAQVTVNITGSTFTDNRASGVLTSFTNSAAHTVNISSSTFADNNTAIDLGVELDSDLNFTIQNNASIVGSTANAINIVSGTGATNQSDLRGTISGNTVGNGSPDSGSQNAFGIAVDLRGDVDAVLAITNNTVRNTDIEGIFVQSRLDNDADGEVGLIDLTLRDNTVFAPDDNSAFPFGFVYGTRVESRNTSNLCLDIAGNTSAGVGGAEHFRVRQRDTSTFRAERLALGAQTAATMQTFVAAQNDPGSTAAATAATSYTGVATGACRKP